MTELVLDAVRLVLLLSGALLTATSIADLEFWDYRAREIVAKAILGVCLMCLGVYIGL